MLKQLKQLKKILRNIFSSDSADDEPQKKKNAPKAGKNPAARSRGRNRKNQTGTENAPRSANEPELVRKPKRVREKRYEDAKPVLPEAAHPVKPEKLEEVPLCEGKTRFLDLELHEDIQFGIQYAKFQYCTPIQELAARPLLEGRDLAGKAQTGTGKTAVFLLAGFQHLLSTPAPENRKNGDVRMLVLAPTRELAIQIHKDALQLGVFTNLSMVCLFGGMDYEKQRRSLEKPLDLVIATPGRLIDYMQNSCVNLQHVEVLVIDEADRMLDMGFIPDVKRIVSRLPKKGERQTLLFSATLDEAMLRLCSGWLADPVVIESEPEKLVSDHIEQIFYSVSREEKLAMVLHLLKTEPFDRVLIFGNRKDINLKLQYDLARYGYDVPVLSGDIPQEKRIRVLEKFRTGETKIVIATDVAARGIHVDDVSLVINYDLPERAEDYVHRIGRTGRAGHSGKAISFLCEYGAYYLPAIEDMLKTTFHSIPPTDEMLVMPEPAANAHLPTLKTDDRHGHGGHGGRSFGRGRDPRSGGRRGRF